MAEYPPPKEIDAIFNPLNFYDTDTSGIGGGGGGGGGSYLNYPVAQGTETLQTTNINGLLTVNDDEIVNGQVSINGPGGLNSYTGSIITNGTMYSQNHPGSTLWQFTDVTNATIGTFKVNNNNFYIYSGGNNGTQNFQVKDTGGTIQTPLALNYTTTTVNTVNPLTYGPANVQPASNDSSTKIPSTAWVQSAITNIPASIPTMTAYANNMLTSFNGFSFSFFGPTGVSAQDQFFTIRLNVNINYGTSDLTTTPAANSSYFTANINIYPYWLINSYQSQQYFTQFPSGSGSPNNVVLNGMWLGFNPVANSFGFPILGTVYTPPPAPIPPQPTYWQTMTGFTNPNGQGFNLTSICAQNGYPNTAATWMTNRWAWTTTVSSYNMNYPGGTMGNYFQILPQYDGTHNSYGIRLMSYNPAVFANTYNTTNSFYQTNITCEIINKGAYTFNYFMDRGGGQWDETYYHF